MMTRISIKVTLAWSTCAQMGFMLMQCGLGLYELALLHLVAHSLYKAHAFLAAGGAVEQTRAAAADAASCRRRASVQRLFGALSAVALVRRRGAGCGASPVQDRRRCGRSAASSRSRWRRC